MGMAPGGKIKIKIKGQVEQHLQNFLVIADAMAKNNNWSPDRFGQWMLKEMVADLHAISAVDKAASKNYQ